jgi:hypothetical protein
MQPAQASVDARLWLGLSGSIILFVGTFAPALSVPIVGSQNFFQNGTGYGLLLLALVGISLLSVLARNYRPLLLTGIVSLGSVLVEFIVFQQRLSSIMQETNDRLANNPFRGIADVALGSIQIQWGWAVLFVGSIVLIVAGAMSPPGARGAA